MSLDVYLEMKNAKKFEPMERIFVRENGQTKEISREEWDKCFPGREPVTVIDEGNDGRVYEANITHNLTKMASEVGVYYQLWRPEEVGIIKANQLVEPLEKGLSLLESDPERFKIHNPSNGWGDYEGLVRFVRNYLEACREYPDAEVSVWK